MVARCPEVRDYPSDEWIDAHISDTGMVDQNNSADAEGRITLSALKEILNHHEGVRNETLQS